MYSAAVQLMWDELLPLAQTLIKKKQKNKQSWIFYLSIWI